MENKIQRSLARTEAAIESTIREATSLGNAAIRDIKEALERMQQSQRTPTMSNGESTVPCNAVRLGRSLEQLQAFYDQATLLKHLLEVEVA